MKKTLIFLLAALTLAAACKKTPKASVKIAPAIEMNISDMFEGGIIPLTITATGAWEILPPADDDLWTVEPLKGDASVTGATLILFPNITGDVYPLSITIKAVDNPESTCPWSAEIRKHGMELGGETYSLVYASGKWWTENNIHYVPSNWKVSNDPEVAADAYYPYTIKDGSAVVLEAAEDVKAYGLLYKGSSLFAENAPALCPEGYHIPTRLEYADLVGNAIASSDKTVEAIKDDSGAYLWDDEDGYASIINWNDAGLNFIQSGFVNGKKYQTTVVKENLGTDADPVYAEPILVGKPNMTYVWSSDINPGATNPQHFALMTTVGKASPKGKLSVAYSNDSNACSVRCIKDAIVY